MYDKKETNTAISVIWFYILIVDVFFPFRRAHFVCFLTLKIKYVYIRVTSRKVRKSTAPYSVYEVHCVTNAVRLDGPSDHYIVYIHNIIIYYNAGGDLTAVWVFNIYIHTSTTQNVHIITLVINIPQKPFSIQRLRHEPLIIYSESFLNVFQTYNIYVLSNYSKYSN